MLETLLPMLDNSQGLANAITRSPSLARAAALVEAELMVASAGAGSEAASIEIPALTLVEKAKAQGIEQRDVQFVLDVVKPDVYAIAARRRAGAIAPMDAPDLMPVSVDMFRMLCRQQAGDAGATITPVHVFKPGRTAPACAG